MVPSVISASGSSLDVSSAVAGQYGSPKSVQQVAGPIAGAGVPWEVWCGVLAVTSATLGLEWDISWHQSIGRDTFWTPAHMMIYLCGAVTGVVCAYLVMSTSFARSSKYRAHSMTVFGFRAPLGCFLATWGGLAMLLSAPFDNWWHAAYGLDVKVLSPPHCLLAIGLNLICFGFLLLTAGAMNRGYEAGTASFHTLQSLFLYLGGLIILLQMLLLSARIDRPLLHNSSVYKNCALLIPFLFALYAQASRSRWAAVSAAAVFSLIRIGTILIFPLFAATPKLGPVLTPVTHLIPSQFPLLIIVPALLLDLVWRRTDRLKPLQNAILSGVIFTASLVAVEWPFGTFLLSKASENRFFGTLYFGFQTLPADRNPAFAFPQAGFALSKGLLIATALGILSSWMGLRLGAWTRSLQR